MSEENISPLPASDLDLNLMLTNSVWGRQEVPEELKEALSKFYAEPGEDGKVVITKSSAWGLLGIYTRDLRLGNLSDWNNELIVCRYMIDLASDLLSSNMAEPFLISMSRAASILETSQSKGGFLRKIMNTLIQKQTVQQLEPPKRGFMGGNKEQNRGGGF